MTQQKDTAAAPLAPHQAFDALYEFCAPSLVRQAYLLTGKRELARDAVERAFQLAWHRWPEVAVDRDPAGWIRAASHDCALSPWNRLHPRYRHAGPPPADPSHRALLQALLTLPPVHRRTLLLHDGIGLGLPETAAETEASTPATASRLLYARATVAALVPEPAIPEVLRLGLAEPAAAELLPVAGPLQVRARGEGRARHWTRATIASTVALIGATALNVCVAPDHYERPVGRGTAVRGLPPRPVMGPSSPEELALRTKLGAEIHKGPGRLVPAPH
ncbi:RNA polymerase subunit sigma-70 [Streptomyces sp. NPDC001020]